MWLAAFFVILVVCFAFDRTFKYHSPEAYGWFSKITWTIEGLFIAAALFGLVYAWYTGKLLFAPT
jgi:hypothetical protein